MSNENDNNDLPNQEDESKLICPECGSTDFSHKFQVHMTIECSMDYKLGAFVDIECEECGWGFREPFEDDIEDLIGTALFGGDEEELTDEEMENVLGEKFKNTPKKDLN